jgi:hypothetical protein
MHRVLTPPQLITNPYHLWEDNKFKGDGTDYLAYRRKYDKMKETRAKENKEWSVIESQMQGTEIVKTEPVKPLIDRAVEAGARVRG